MVTHKMMIANAEFFGAIQALTPSYLPGELLSILKFANARFFDEELPSIEYVNFCRSLVMTIHVLFSKDGTWDSDADAKMLMMAWRDKISDLLLEYNA